MNKNLSSRHVFLSYSRDDITIVTQIQDKLKSEGIEVWIDVNLMPGTASWKKEIEKAICDSIGIVAILSPSSKQSEWVERELGFAELQGKKIFPILVYGKPADVIPIALTSAQWIDLRDVTDFSTQIEKLILALKDEVDKRDQSQAPKDEGTGVPSVLVVGSAVREKVLKFNTDLRLGCKQTADERKELYGGSGMNYTLRLRCAGYNVLPILSIGGSDSTGREIQDEILKIAHHKAIEPFITEEDFRCVGLQTPESIVAVTEEARTILTGKLEGFGVFREFVDSRLKRLKDFDRLEIKAVMIGHIYADNSIFCSDQNGLITKDIIDRWADQGVMIFTNFGRSQFERGNKFWQETLQKVTVFQLALDEARVFFRQDQTIKSLRDMIKWFQENHITAIITMDKVGAIATLNDRNEGVIFAQPYDLHDRFVDSTGAGDAFGAGFVSYFLDRIVDYEKSRGKVGKDELAEIFSFGNFYEAIKKGRNWATHCCTTLGAASECLDNKSLEEFSRTLKNQDSTLETGSIDNFNNLMWFIDRAH